MFCEGVCIESVSFSHTLLTVLIVYSSFSTGDINYVTAATILLGRVGKGYLKSEHSRKKEKKNTCQSLWAMFTIKAMKKISKLCHSYLFVHQIFCMAGSYEAAWQHLPSPVLRSLPLRAVCDSPVSQQARLSLGTKGARERGRYCWQHDQSTQ